MPEIAIKTFIIVLHLIGLCIGLGGAWIMDLILFRFFQKQDITQEKVDLLHFMSKLVTIGLVLLWVSGLAFLAIYYLDDAAKLANQKIWGKFAIVVVLTLNGIFLHLKVIPMIHSFVGGKLYDRSSYSQKLTMFGAGVVSAVSWVVPFVLGVSKELNNQVTVFGVLSVYVFLLAVAAIMAVLYLTIVVPKIINASTD